MTPKEKANELYNKFFYKIPFTDNKGEIENDGEIEHKTSKQCSLIAVDEIIKATVPLSSTYYWQEVKQEIINL